MAGLGISRASSARSVSSTLYSSNASVVEARPARRSVGGAHMIEEVPLEGRSPFADPTDFDQEDGGGRRE